MSRTKILAAILVALALLSIGSTSPAKAQEQFWAQRGFGIDVSVSYGMGAGYEPTPGIGAGVKHTTSRTQTFFGGAGGPAEKTGQTEGSWWAYHLGEEVRVTKRGSVLAIYTKGCFEGKLFDSCAERVSFDYCFRPDDQGICAGATASLRDIHDYGDVHLRYSYILPEQRLFGHHLGLSLNNGRTRFQGVAGMPGFDRITGMSDEFQATIWFGASYSLSF